MKLGMTLLYLAIAGSSTRSLSHGKGCPSYYKSMYIRVHLPAIYS